MNPPLQLQDGGLPLFNPALHAMHVQTLVTHPSQYELHTFEQFLPPVS